MQSIKVYDWKYQTYSRKPLTDFKTYGKNNFFKELLERELQSIKTSFILTAVSLTNIFDKGGEYIGNRYRNGNRQIKRVCTTFW